MARWYLLHKQWLYKCCNSINMISNSKHIKQKAEKLVSQNKKYKMYT